MNRILTGFNLATRAIDRQQAVSKLDFLKTKLVMRLLVLGVFTVILSLFYIWSRVQIVQMGYELNDYKLEQQQLIDENKKLQMELSVMTSPDRIKTYVQEKFNMTLPAADKIIELR